MDFLELVKNRYSVRAYKSTPVEDDKLNRILEAARLAPTGANRQSFQLIVIHTAGREEELKLIYSRDWFVQAPVIICACAVPVEGQPYREAGHYRNIAIVMDHLILAAASLGLGTCWIGAFSQDEARDILEIPPSCTIVSLLTLGFPNQEGRPKNRKTLEEIVCYDTYKE